MATAGQLGRKDLVWTAKLGQWSEAGTIQDLCPELPPAPPPVPTKRVVGKVVVNGQRHNGVVWFKIAFDNAVLGESRLRTGCDLAFQTTTGDHVLEVACTGAMMATKTKTCTISFREEGNYRITLHPKMGFLGMSPTFADEAQIQKTSGHA